MNVVLGVSGSISAYRAADLARDLVRAGFTVRVCLTDSAQKFVTTALFEVLTGQPCLVDTFEEPETGRMAHIDWARQADLIVVAPATANTINKLAAGIGDDMLTTLVLASTAPLVIAPAMNPQMYANEVTQQSLLALSARAAVIVEPQDGDVACGEHGQGKLAANAEILDAVNSVALRNKALAGKHVVITGGPTQEAIDDVRFLTNRSSGKMGVALARAALLMGARVTVVSGPVRVVYPLQAEVKRVSSANEMMVASLEAAKDAGCHQRLPRRRSPTTGQRDVVAGKIAEGPESFNRRSWYANPDIIAAVASQFPKATVVGFAAEPSKDLETAREKLLRKGLHAIAVNDISQPGIGFDADNNELTILTKDGETKNSGRRSKLGCAI